MLEAILHKKKTTSSSLHHSTNGSSSLHQAAGQGDLAALETLLEGGANPEARDRLGKTPLHEACASGNFECAARLLRAGAKPSTHKSNGITPVHVAAARGHTQIVALLLTSGARALEGDHKGETAVHLAARAGALDVLQLLLSQGSRGGQLAPQDLNPEPWREDEKGLWAKPGAGRGEDSTGRLPPLPAVNVQTNNGRTPLHSAARNGHLAVVDWLLAQGADPGLADSSGMLPIHEAAASGHSDCLALLLAAVPRSQTAVHVANRGTSLSLSDVNKSVNATPARHARDVTSATLSFVAAIDGAGCTPLHHAAAQGQRDCVQKLLEAGADSAARDTSGATPLYWAASRGQAETLFLLLDARGADPNSANLQRTVLHAAAGWGRVPAVAALLGRGADPTVGDAEGRTPLALLSSLPPQRRSAEVAALLRAAEGRWSGNRRERE